MMFFFFLLLFITIQAVSKFIALIPCRSICQMMVNFSGVEFERAVSCSHYIGQLLHLRENHIGRPASVHT